MTMRAAATVHYKARNMREAVEKEFGKQFTDDLLQVTYEDGESNREADYTAAFDEWPRLHYREDVTAFANKVRDQYIALVEAWCRDSDDPEMWTIGDEISEYMREVEIEWEA
jgi:hypothetical protein